MLSKFLNSKTLIIILVILIGIYLITEYSKKEDRSFKSELVTVDTADINKVLIIPQIGSGDEITLSKTGYEWSLNSAGKSYMPDNGMIRRVLASLVNLKPERVAATSDSKWKEMQVTDSTATRVKLLNGDKVITDIYLGKFNYTQPKGQQQNPYQQNQGKMSTFVRLAGENVVYVVDGYLKMNVPAQLNSYRNKTLCKANPEDITRVTLKYPNNENLILTKTNDQWLINDFPADSAKTAQYINKLRNVTSANFAEGIPSASSPSHYAKIEGNNILPIEIKAFPADSVHQYILTSSLVPETKFSNEKGGIFEKIFPMKEEFIADIE
jgi:hypothetical protein